MLTITAGARATVLEVLANEADAASLALWLEVSGESNGAYAYDMYFQALADAGAARRGAARRRAAGRDPCGAASTGCSGATLDYVDRRRWRERSGHRQPQHAAGPPSTARPSLRRSTSPTRSPAGRGGPRRAGQSFSIAAHGGRADLVAVEDASVYLRLSGGCQGCGMAKATLSQGIEVILREAIPEIADIVDVTDHADGTNPYYEPAGS